MKNEDIIKGIAAYKYEQDRFMRLLKRRKQFTVAEFDFWFRNREYKRTLKRSLIHGDSFMLGLGNNGFNYWAEMLTLLQYMCRLKLIDAKTVDGKIVYFVGEAA